MTLYRFDGEEWFALFDERGKFLTAFDGNDFRWSEYLEQLLSLCGVKWAKLPELTPAQTKLLKQYYDR